MTSKSRVLFILAASLLAETVRGTDGIGAPRPPSLNARRIYTDTPPGARAFGDFNGDAILDMVVSQDAVTIYPGRADGTFDVGRSSFLRGVNLLTLQTADLNGDGRLDVAVGERGTDPGPGRMIYVLLGNGEGGLGAEQGYQTSDRPFSILIADLNNDGVPDLVAGGSAWLGEGDGTFRTGSVISGLLAAADFNRDGRTDLLVQTASQQMAIRLALDDGTYQSLPSFFVPRSGSVGRAQIGDLDGDGVPDLVHSSYPYIHTWRSLGDGRMMLSGEYPGPTGSLGPSLLGDLNADGRADLAVVDNRFSINGNSTVSILLGTPQGALAPGLSYSVGRGVDHLQIVDFNRDGYSDLTLTASGQLAILPGHGDGTFGARRFPTGSDPSRAITGDLNGDGFQDLITSVPGARAVSVVLGQGDGSFSAYRHMDIGEVPGALAAGDFNGDGYMDVAAATAGGRLAILLGEGDGTLQRSLMIEVGSDPVALAAGDFDYDGTVDVIVASRGSRSLTFLPGQGDGTFGPPREMTLPDAPRDMTVADFNGDAIPDVATANGDASRVAIFLGNGDGTFGAPFSVGVLGTPHVVRAADFNGDGYTDLAVASLGSPRLIILQGNGDGTLGRELLNRTLLNNPMPFAVGDFNGDRVPDLAVPCPLPADRLYVIDLLYLFVGRGDGSVEEYRFGSGLPAGFALAEDFDLDGRTDLALLTTQAVSIAMNRAP